MAVQTQIQTRRGAAATWTSTNPTLAAGEIGFESDTNKFKIGTGSTAWASLPYASNVSPLTTKGDLYTYSTDNARLSVGADGETLVADSSTSTGLRYTENYAAGKNAIINGDFRINQRGFTSNTSSGDVYEFDRWQSQSPNSGTVTRTAEVFTLGAAPVAGYEATNFYRYDVAGQSGATARAVAAQKIESVRTFAGETVTVSFWAKAASGTPGIAVAFQQYFGTGGSPSSVVTIAGGKNTISTSWARYSYTVAVPSISGKTIGTNNNDSLFLQIWFSGGSDFDARTTSLGIQTNTFDIWGVQVEAGSVATAFQTATGTLQGELSACQRYYYRTVAGSTFPFGLGFNDSTTAVKVLINLPVTMRTRPTALEQTGTAGDYTIRYTGGAGATAVCSAVPAFDTSTTDAVTITATVASGLTGGQASLLRSSSATAYLGWSAEL
jgi:hypothetical protein